MNGAGTDRYIVYMLNLGLSSHVHYVTYTGTCPTIHIPILHHTQYRSRVRHRACQNKRTSRRRRGLSPPNHGSVTLR